VTYTDSERGQALLLMVAAMLAVLLGAIVLGGVARGVAAQGDGQRAADLGALAGARTMHEDYGRLFEPVLLDDRPNPRHLERGTYLERARRVAEQTAWRNGARAIRVSFPGADRMAPVRIRVTVGDALRVADRQEIPLIVRAEAELVPPGGAAPGGTGAAGEYAGPFAVRQGKPMRPDVAGAFDRLFAAARSDGVALLVVSAFRSDVEQARLFAARPDPRWVARPGTSLHRLGTELDLGPASAYGWLAANAPHFGFVKRNAWEPWHFGWSLNAASAGAAAGGGSADGSRHRAMPGFVPDRLAPAISRAAQRWNVSAALLAAQLYVESGFNPFARSPAGAQGIAQFMPGTARRYGLADPFDADRAIGAQAHLMRDLLRRFASVPLALAAYNAGEGAVARCNCSHPFPETAAYVAKILGLLGGAGEPGGGAAGLTIRLVR
jgi:hypothetical protein